jgi:hypothetical protein
MEESTRKTEGIGEKTVPITIRQPGKLYLILGLNTELQNAKKTYIARTTAQAFQSLQHIFLNHQSPILVGLYKQLLA